MVKSREESEKNPALYVLLCLQSYSRLIAEWRRERKLVVGVEKEEKEGGKKKKRTRERKHRQPWFAVTPPQASCAIFNTQAYVLSNLSPAAAFNATSASH